MNLSNLTTIDKSILNAHRAWSITTLIAWLWHSERIYNYFSSFRSIRLESDFFPSILNNIPLASFAFIAALCALAVSLIFPNKKVWFASAAVIMGACLYLALGPFGFAWQFFTTTFWSCWFFLWLATRCEQQDPRSMDAGIRMALMIVSLVFLGGAVGKWTARYWSGEVFFHLLFLYQPDPKFAMLREALEPKELFGLATLYSRLAIIAETCLALVWLLPAKLGLIAALFALLGMWLISPTGIIDAIGPLIGLLLGGLVLTRSPPRSDVGDEEE